MIARYPHAHNATPDGLCESYVTSALPAFQFKLIVVTRLSRNQVVISLHRYSQWRRDWPRSAFAYKSHAHMRLNQKIIAAHDTLVQCNRRALHLFRLSDDVEYVVHMCRL